MSYIAPMSCYYPPISPVLVIILILMPIIAYCVFLKNKKENSFKNSSENNYNLLILIFLFIGVIFFSSLYYSPFYLFDMLLYDPYSFFYQFSPIIIISIPIIIGYYFYQEKVKESALELGAGSDGSVYMLRYKRLAAFSSSGKKRYVIEIPCSTVYGRPVANSQGEVFVISDSRDDSKQILRISADGQTISVVAESGQGEEEWNSPRTLILEPDGTFHVLGYGGTWITLKPSS